MAVKTKLRMLSFTFFFAMFGAISCTSDEEVIEEPIESSDSFEVSAPPEESVSVPSFAPVYFDFDSSVVQGRFDGALSNIGTYLRDNPNSSIELEGHCDSRGTEQYNLALGDRRANSVKEILANYGAAPSQMTTISYGEERPAREGHGEMNWRMNRRVEFIFN